MMDDVTMFHARGPEHDRLAGDRGALAFARTCPPWAAESTDRCASLTPGMFVP
jgi:hypothetical protein